MPERFLLVPYQNAMLLHGERAELLTKTRDAKILRSLIEHRGSFVPWEDLADAAGMVGEWAQSDCAHSMCRIKKLFCNSLVMVRPNLVRRMERGDKFHAGWSISGPIDVLATVLPIV